MSTVIFAIIIIVITGLAVWFDLRAYQKPVRGLLIGVSGLLLLGFITQPKWWTSELKRYALITDGFSSDTFPANEYENVFSLRDEDKNAPKYNWLSSASMISDHVPAASEIDVYGSGIARELPEGYLWRDQLTKPQQGLKLLEAPHQVETGSAFEIELSAQGIDSVSIYKDGELRSVLSTEDDSLIVFTDRTHIEGPVVYDLEWRNSDSLNSETLNVRATQPNLLEIGVMLYSPSFEINYLSEHLGERGHTILSRSRVGQDRFRFDAMNGSTETARSLINSLSELDLLILDHREFGVTTVSEKQLLKDAINDGLDVLLTAPSLEAIEKWSYIFAELSQSKIETETLNRLEERNWIPEILRSDNELLTPIPILNAQFTEVPETADMLYDDGSSSKPVSARLTKGSGSITGQLFYRTYPWLIEGNIQAYNAFWVDYLSQIITLESGPIDINPMIPRKDHKMDIVVPDPVSFEKIKVKSVFDSDTLLLPVKQSLGQPGVLSASFWPEAEGWHYAEYGNRSKWFYVYEHEWDFDLTARTYQATRKQIDTPMNSEPPTESPSKTKVPDFIWLLGFLSIQVFLWAERKLS